MAALIPGLIGLGTSLYAGYKAGKERDKQMNLVLDQQRQNQEWYDRNYLSDYTQRADTQALIKNLRDNMQKANKRAAATAVVTGATPEAQAVQKEQTNKVLTDTYSKIGAQGAAWKDQIMNNYLNRKYNLYGQQNNLIGQKAEGYENLQGNALNVLGNAFSTLI
jgi:hypothetical protein